MEARAPALHGAVNQDEMNRLGEIRASAAKACRRM